MAAQTILIVIRWFARALAVASVAILLLFLFGEPFRLPSITWVQFVALIFFPFGLIAGLVLGWFRELAGGLVAVGSVTCFYLLLAVVEKEWPGWWFLVFAIPGILFIVYGVARMSSFDDLGKKQWATRR